MDDILVWFADYVQRKEVDSCAVAILTHGCKEEVLFGRDGKFVSPQTGSGVQHGTYIKTSRLRQVFSTSRCRAMQGKPKLFIIQACKGNLEDTYDGQRPYRRDLPVAENDTPHTFPDQADMVFLNAAVDDYIAYRNLFIKHLVGVFTQHAATKHLLDLGTELNGRMAGEIIEDHIFTISEKKDTLCKTFYLNPPNESTPRYPVITLNLSS
ncbi:caspase-14-like isoform X2 [Littorina saxatilis]|uniref:caspase-14-like isoform X2 n=1 Tax=Littorina saxatilis TaxID=31220 RepID=UPI0038B64318